MDRILISLKKESGLRASSAPALGLNTIIFKHFYWYMQQTQVSVYRTIGPLVTIYSHGGHLGYVTWTIYSNFHSPFLTMLHLMFGFDWASGFREEDV